MQYIKKWYFLFFIAVQFMNVQLTAQNYIPVLLDEDFSEWRDLEDIATSGDFSIKAINTEEQLFIYFEIAEAIAIQNSERIILYLDTDDNVETGRSIHGIGAEIEVNFGLREVTTIIEGSTSVYGFKNINLNLMPTVWSDQFEVAIERDAMFFPSEGIKILVEDIETNVFSPLSEGGATYTFGDFEFDSLPTHAIEKLEESHLRMMSHNVLRDDLFESSKRIHFQRMYQAIDPDIIGFQEIYDHTATDVVSIMEDFLPSEQGEAWYASKVNDNIVASRFPILSTHKANVDGNGAFLLDLRPDYETPLLVINAHTPCCTNDAGREYEIDAMMAFVRDAKAGVGSFALKKNTPIVVMGDMNLVGDPQNIQTLLDGNIQNESTWGMDFVPDWNGNNFLDAKPRVTGLPMTFTHWSYEGSGGYSTGRLDAIMYSGSGLTLENSFVLYTSSMSIADLATYNLELGDSEGASDHLPMVVDFLVTAEVEQNLGFLDVRQNNVEGLPFHQGETVTLNGVVTASAAFGENQAFFQNGIAGVAISGAEFVSQISRGDSIQIKGRIDQYNGLTQLTYNNGSSSVSVLGSVELPDPQVVTVSEIFEQSWDGLELLEGTLVRLKGVQFEEKGAFEKSTLYVVSDGKEYLSIWIDPDTEIAGLAIPEGSGSIVGVLSQFDHTAPYNSGYQFVPRDRNDFDFEHVVTAFNDDLGLHNLQISPNPARDYIQISLAGNGHAQISIRDMSGREVMSYDSGQAVDFLTVDISALKPGIYTCTLSFANKEVTQKFVVSSN